MDKQMLRTTIEATRAAIPDERRHAASVQIRESLLDLPWVQMAGLVACYWSVGTEPATHGLVFALWKHGATVILPVLRDDDDLDWAVYDGPDTLAPGRFGIMEPVDTRRGVDAIRTAALVIVPALAVDRSTGVRLGRGGGSYDRALARVGPNVPTVALLHEGELLDGVPAEPHDVAVRYAATPGGVFRTGATDA
ncbi:5-formyltetrahydrofolate cyclo-ligase [Streptosporangium sp. NBC_01755]|uniref:5-formyltetrahydrofolate cyclo-ligase n=1 Tax=unclassified Streptosporangium TaxID=2632669 RepID=UPI002DDA0DCD|nr:MULTISPECIES: 5-formyltetrahydrofolate cyclo-ligase [unclassified Streptosporangium]WSA26010.1 5-formyltetrahydrofolate cyclo-ligase [Streptosporangium sp. NBC_01810]WSD02568.1 5-formyltetrahydrofolate cyclo-ligase [Streptosporangium sp. NBC_01755]